MNEHLAQEGDPTYAVSKTEMRELEEVWLASRGGRAPHLQVHQCLAVLFDILGTDKSDGQQLTPPGECLQPLFEEIGKRLSLSPFDVAQKLQEAKNGGILRVSARLAVATGTELQQKLSKVFSITAPKNQGPPQRPFLRIIVGEVKNRYLPQKDVRGNAVAEAAADYFVTVVPPKPLAKERPDHAKEKPDHTGEKLHPTSGWIGVSGGNTMLNVVQHILEGKAGWYEGLTVIPLAGEAEPEKFGISANSVVLRLAEACVPGKAETFSLMTTPIVAGEGQIDKLRENQEESPSIEKVIRRARHVKFAFTGIGAKGLSEEDALRRLAKHCGIRKSIPQGVVGDICYRPIDRDGHDGWPELSRRLVGPTLQDLWQMSSMPNSRRVFAVACGEDKVQPIIAAIRGGLVNGLITDELTALEILKCLDELPETQNLT